MAQYVEVATPGSRRLHEQGVAVRMMDEAEQVCAWLVCDYLTSPGDSTPFLVQILMTLVLCSHRTRVSGGCSRREVREPVFTTCISICNNC